MRKVVVLNNNGFEEHRGTQYEFDGGDSSPNAAGPSPGQTDSAGDGEGAAVFPSSGQLSLSDPLTLQEEQAFWRCEKKVEDGLRSAQQGREALRQIRDGRLYRAEFKTFDEYVERRWKMSVRQAHRICDHAEVMTNLLGAPSDEGAQEEAPAMPAVLPETESLARPLAPLPPEVQREVWQNAVATAPVKDGKPVVTARHVAETIRGMVKKEEGSHTEETETIPQKEMKFVLDVESVEKPAAQIEQAFDAADKAIIACRRLGDLIQKEDKVSHQRINSAVEQLELVEERLHAYGAMAKTNTEKWVICRRASPGSIIKSIRFGPGWGNDPNKAKHYASEASARAAAKSYDEVITLSQALADVSANNKLEAKVWPKPNKSGVFSDGDGETLRFKAPKCSADIRVLEIGPEKWIWATRYNILGVTTGSCGHLSPLSRSCPGCKTRAAAVCHGAKEIIELSRAKLKRSDASPAHRSEAKKLMAWAEQQRSKAMGNGGRI